MIESPSVITIPARRAALIALTIYGALTVWTTPSLEMPL